jgi:hypothetical protein
MAAAQSEGCGKKSMADTVQSQAEKLMVFISYAAQEVVDKVKASVRRCLTPEGRKQFHLREVSRWRHARNLWPYVDHTP